MSKSKPVRVRQDGDPFSPPSIRPAAVKKPVRARASADNPSDVDAAQKRMDATGWKKCGGGTRCAMLDDRIEGDANARRKGFVLMVAMHLESGDMRVVGVCYKMSGKDSGLMLNFCPFCGGDLTSGFISKLGKAAPDPTHIETQVSDIAQELIRQRKAAVESLRRPGAE